MGARFGMELHWSKFQLLPVNGSYKLQAPDGAMIEPKDLMTYLGVTVYADGTVKSELNKKLGYAWPEFKKMEKLWKHSSLQSVKKVRILNATVLPCLLYGLDTVWLDVAETRRLNGFYCRCLRAALRIKPAFVSRVSNDDVLRQAGQVPLSQTLLRRQLLLYGKVVRSPEGDPLRDLTFMPGTRRAATDRYIRKVGRPRNEWAKMLERETNRMCLQPDTVIHDIASWRATVDRYCMSTG